MTSEVRNKIDEFRAKTADFAAGNIGVKEYKGFSGYFGSYAQRGAKNSMLRLRITGGRLSKDGIRNILDICDKYDINLMHTTTCQTIQLHDLPLDKVADIMEETVESGFFTFGGGGDFPRNVMVSPLSGVQQGENFDVFPYAECASQYLLSQLGTVKMPRKLKVCFSNSPENAVHATFRDLGFVSRPDGLFDVYCAGGMGANPKMGVKVREGENPEKILYYIRAMIALFCEYGNYENRAKARTRYMQDTLGDRFKDEFNRKLDAAFIEGGLDISPEITSVTKKGEAAEFTSSRVIAQKQEGLYAVSVHPAGGRFSPELLRTIYETIRDMDDVSLRLAPDEGMYIVNCTGSEVKRVLDTVPGGEKAVERSVACIGASICQQGLRDSQVLLRDILAAVEPYDFPADALPMLHISGCVSSCGTHEIGEMGFQGKVKLVDKKPRPAFAISIKGCDMQGAERFGDELGTIVTEEIPVFITELGKAVTAAQMSYRDYARQREDELMALITRFTS